MKPRKPTYELGFENMNLRLNRLPGTLFVLMMLGSLSGSIAALFGLSVPINYIRYAIVIMFFAYITILVWWKSEYLEQFNFDRATILLIILSGIFRSRLDIPNERYYKWTIALFALLILLACYKNWKHIPKTKWRWVGIGLLSCFCVIPLSFIETLRPDSYQELGIGIYGFGLVLAQKILYNISFVAVLEESLYRGFLWGYLRRMAWNENRIFWVQAILFWLSHIWQIGSPATFFITIPIATLITSLLTRYSKQLLPSIIAHTIIDSIVPLLTYFLLH